ncbi:ethanolamine utilization protein EutH [Tepidanaerobacter sp. GT38]|uniref:ethanolamine utilization protein EutH n=1 Tax=Tepidanaerobacter sp. GT38 TaxID=2722793 RepID=UPI001F21F2F3|nr:ethanolamine utilization protein EutH [Tepidanaerobacter sp. GT38]MCG1012344.1 ethanolamine utilization protein EutH [Tepidanaerobacter sp. GT38]
MGIHSIILYIMLAGSIIGGIDRLFGNKLGLGEKFEEGFNAMGPIALAIVGIVSLAPVLANLVKPIVSPILKIFGADPAMAAAIIANDMGGYSLAIALAESRQAGLFSGLIVAAMLGCTLVFSMPLGLGLIEQEDRPHFFKGIMLGLISIPFGSILGGMVAGFEMAMLAKNTVPIAVISVVLALYLWQFPSKAIKIASYFGLLVEKISLIGLILAVFYSFTDIQIIPGLSPIWEGLTITAQIGVMLLGAFPVVHILVKLLSKPLNIIGSKIGLDEASTGGLLLSLASSIPVYGMMRNMNPRGKVMNAAFLVPATATFGAHLGFTAGVYSEMIVPVIAGKLFAGIIALILSYFFTRDL